MAHLDRDLERTELISGLCRAAGAGMAVFVIPDPESAEGYKIEIGYNSVSVDQSLELMAEVQKWAGVPPGARVRPDTDDETAAEAR